LEVSIEILRMHEIFQDLSDEILNAVMKKINKDKIPKNYIIFNEGEIGDRIYFILSGEVSIMLESKYGDQINLATLKEKEVFGEMALLGNTVRSAIAKAETDCDLLYLLKEDFDALITEYSSLSLALNKILSNRLTLMNKRLLNQNTKKPKPKSLKDIPAEVFDVIKSKMTRVDVAEGKVVFREGEYGKKYYIIEKGEVSVSAINKKGEEIQLTTLREGDQFGEMAMLTDARRTATIKTLTNCKLLYLGKKEFDILIQNNSVVAFELSKILSKRLSSTINMLTEKEENKVVLIIADEHQASVIEHFALYLNEIFSKNIIFYRDINRDKLLLEFDKLEDTYFIIHNPKGYADILSIATDIVNFGDPIEGYINIDTNKSHYETRQQLKKIARKIAGKSIGVALSSGTALGLAHIGVMKVLLENNIPIDYIAGTSGGSLYGAPYAYGYSYNEIYETFEKELKKPTFFMWDIAFKKSGLLKGQRALNKTIRKLLGKKLIEDSKIPFAAVATDLYTGSEEVITKGSFMDAIRASISIPIIFTPFRKKDKLFVDGVVTTPVPVSALEQSGINIKIAVYVSELTKFEKKNPDLMSIFLRARNIASDFIADESIERADVIIKPKLKDVKQFDYHKIDEIIKAGEDAARKVLPRINRLLQL
jgi:NTE family protein